MQEAVSSILIGRSREAEGLSRMVLISLVIHGVLMTALVLVPRDWLRGQPEEQAPPMMISLGPSGTADTGGMTAITSAPVQAESPTDAKPLRPAEKTPEMLAPAPEVKPKVPEKPVAKPIEKSATKKPSTGPEIKSGAARVVTPNAAQIPFGGLAERAGGASAGGPRLDVANFCCPEYIETMTQRIRSNWDQQQGAAGQHDREIHDSQGRHADQCRGREEQRQPAARPGIEAGRPQHAPTASSSGSVHPTAIDRVPGLRLQALMRSMKLLTSLFTVSAALALAAQNPPATQPPQQQQPDSIADQISGDPGRPPRLAVPEFIPLGKEPDVIAAAKTIADVLWDDFAYEKEFYLLPRDILRTVPRPASVEQVSMDRWKELGADGVVIGTVRKICRGHRRRSAIDARGDGRDDAGQAVQRLGEVA